MNPKINNLFKSSYQSGVLIVFLTSIILYLLEWRNQVINLLDFEVYYRSASRMMRGENLYRIASDDYFIFKYSPVSAIFYFSACLSKKYLLDFSHNCCCMFIFAMLQTRHTQLGRNAYW